MFATSAEVVVRVAAIFALHEMACHLLDQFAIVQLPGDECGEILVNPNASDSTRHHLFHFRLLLRLHSNRGTAGHNSQYRSGCNNAFKQASS